MDGRTRDAQTLARPCCLRATGARWSPPLRGLREVRAGQGSVHNKSRRLDWTTFFTKKPVTNWTTADKSNRNLYGRFFHAMLDEGVLLAPSQFEAGFISLAHTDDCWIELSRRAQCIEIVMWQVTN